MTSTVVWASFALAADEKPGELLYNGIRLPRQWPPRIEKFGDGPMRVPYLESPPEVINIDVGRQLFVDNFLIEETTLKQIFHRPEYYPGNPVLKPDQPWELGDKAYTMPFSDGVWYDPQDKIFKLWYYTKGKGKYATCLATSKDGIHWDKPNLDVEPGTNIVLKLSRDSNAIWLDPSPRDPSERFKMALYQHSVRRFMLYRSPDGIHWTKASDGAKACDRSTFFYNPFRQRWVFSIRDYWQRVRTRYYWETTDFFSFSDAYKANKDAVKWTAADSNDQPRNDLQVRPQLYNLDCVAYESIMLGMFTIWRGDYRDLNSKKAKEMVKLGRPKTNSVCVGFSRDGFHWDRPDRQPFLPISETRGDWNWGNLQSTVPCCLVVGEKLWFYVSGRAGKSFRIPQKSIDAGASTGVAFLRRDGFASMDAGEQSGELITRPLRFSGGRLFVNADVKSDGELLVEVLDKNNQPIAPFTRENCVPVKVDKTLVPVRWNGATDLADLAGKTVKFRFILKQGRLYSFWVSPNESGASHGYVAGGGPGFTGPTDTVGSGGYGKNEAEKAINK